MLWTLSQPPQVSQPQFSTQFSCALSLTTPAFISPPCPLLLTSHSSCLLSQICSSQRPSGPFFFSASFFLPLFGLFFCRLTPSMANVKLRQSSQVHSHTVMSLVIFPACDLDRMLPSTMVFVHVAGPFRVQSFRSVLLSVHLLLILEVGAVALELPFVFRKRSTVLGASFQDKKKMRGEAVNTEQNCFYKIHESILSVFI